MGLPTMKSKVYCPVCDVQFVIHKEAEKGNVVICLVCGAKLEITTVGPVAGSRRFLQEPETEIRDRIDEYARIKGYVFKEEKEEIIHGLLEKNRRFGDFYCPCRFDHIPENVCPCRETRMNAVRKEGSCL